MSDKILNLTDRGALKDTETRCSFGGLRTDIQMGYDLYKDENGISQLGEVVVSHLKNKIVTGGVAFILEKMFGVSNTFTIENLSTKYNIGTSPVGNVDSISQSHVMLFNVGLDGAGAAFNVVNSVYDQQNDIVPIGDNEFGTMLPFRVVDTSSNPNTGNTGAKYWFKETVTANDASNTPVTKDWYYLKEFEPPVGENETNPTIVSRWKTTSGDDGQIISSDPSTSTNGVGIETYAEIILRINTTDLREYFETYRDSSEARFNSIGLCSGVKTTVNGTDTTYEEFTDVRQISVLYFSNEMLHFDKDLTIIYRIYLS